MKGLSSRNRRDKKQKESEGKSCKKSVPRRKDNRRSPTSSNVRRLDCRTLLKKTRWKGRRSRLRRSDSD